jgi:K+-sensing histidine kinase KdpD
MTQDMAGSGHTGPDENTSPPQARLQSTRARFAITVLNLSIIAALTFAVNFFNAILSSTALLVLYSIPVLLAVLLWNFEQGMIAAFAGVLAAELFYFAPRPSPPADGQPDVGAVLIFLGAALLCGYLLDGVRRSRRAASDDALARAVASRRQVLRLSGAARTVPERIAEFLVGRKCTMYCDQCIQDQLGLKWRQQVQLVTATLAVTNLFRRDSGQCQTCHQLKQVIRHVKPH